MHSEPFIRATLQENHILENLVIEDCNKDYEGFSIHIDGVLFRSRLAKATPKKKGYFVAVWLKDNQGINQAYSEDQTPDKTIISVIDETLHMKGQFVFPKEELIKRGITKTESQKGKMAFRVYPDWVTGLNATAKKTQDWQSLYFIDLSDHQPVKEIELLYFQK
ncbi:MepB family protein [Alkalihalobacillus sp. FSL R5-0424]